MEIIGCPPAEFPFTNSYSEKAQTSLLTFMFNKRNGVAYGRFERLFIESVASANTISNGKPYT
jgi:hypothetical protein